MISVVIPIYNRADYVPAAVDRVLEQSLGDFQFVIVNDGSTNERIVLIEQENTGYARLTGI